MKHRIYRFIFAIVSASSLFFLMDAHHYEAISNGIEVLTASVVHFFEQLLGQEPYLDESTKNICYNGIDPEFLNATQRLKLFNAGPCSPVVLIAGITATSFQAKIDCPVLRDQNPETFADCGWETCDKDSWKSSPKSEYRFWVPDFFSPMSVLSPFKKHLRCWGHFVKLIRNESALDPTKRFVPSPGIKIEFFGNTAETRDSFKCGAGSIIDVFPGPKLLKPRLSINFGKIVRLLEHMGYESGITFMAMPFDFRIAVPHNDLQYTLERSIRLLNKLTKKKAMIVAHSYGNFNTLHLMQKMKQSDKDQLIERVISLFPPFGGTTRGLKDQLGGEEMMYPMGLIGIDIFAQKMYLGTSSAMHDIFPRDFFFKFQNESWMVDILKRMEIEESGNFDTEIPFEWFPNGKKTCVSGLKDRKDSSCGLHLTDMRSMPVAIIQNKSYYAREEDIEELLRTYVVTGPEPMALYNEGRKSELHLFKNPGAKVTLIYGAFHHTEASVEYYRDPRDSINSEKLYIPDKTMYTLGDETVAVESTLIPVLKWAWEFDNQNKSSSEPSMDRTEPKPVQVVEYCSVLGGDLQKMHSKNSYYGLQCECQGGAGGNRKKMKGMECQHIKTLADVNLVRFLGELLISAEPRRFIEDSNIEELDGLLELLPSKCPHLNAPPNLQSPDELLDFIRN